MVIIDDGGGGNSGGDSSKSWGEVRTSSEAVAGAMSYTSPEARWLEERLSGGEGLKSGRGRRVFTLSYSRPGWGRQRTLSLAKAEAERGFAENCEEGTINRI